MNIHNHLTFRLIDGSAQRPNMVRIGDSLYIVDTNAVLRLTLDGSLDKSFDGDGVAYLTNGQLRAYHVAPSSDGLSVYATVNFTYPVLSHQAVSFPSSGLTGAPSSTVALSSLSGDFVNVIGYGKDGVLYLGGTDFVNEQKTTNVARVSKTGVEDAAFSSGAGAAVTATGLWIDKTIVEDSAGRVYLIGTEQVAADYATNTPSYWRSKLVRLQANGEIDPSFGTSGQVTVSKDNGIGAIAILGDGSILVGINGQDATLMKLKADGSVDLAFGTNGYDKINMNGAFAGEYVSKILVDGNTAFAVVTSFPAYKVSVVPIDAAGAEPLAAIEALAESKSENIAAYLDASGQRIVLAIPTWESGGIEAVTISYSDVFRPPVGSAAPIRGTSGNDIFTNTALQDSFDGGAGLDYLVYADVRANYGVSLVQGKVVVENKAGGAKDSLTGIERVTFKDGTLAFDADGVAGQAYRLYKAAFNRTPDPDGLGYWISALDKGLTLNEIAAGFINSAEYKGNYGQSPAHAQLVGKYYTNILGRAPEQAGLNYWVEVLDTGRASEAQVLAAISESAENHAAVIGVIQQGVFYTPFG